MENCLLRGSRDAGEIDAMVFYGRSERAGYLMK
jgi:hypothetical protein